MYDVYIWDCEAYRDKNDMFIPYACACIPLVHLVNKDGSFKDERVMNYIVKDRVNMFEGSNCIE